MRRLEIGSGNRPKVGYEHLDIDPNCPDLDYVSSMDVVPTEDNVFAEIVSIHSIEHIEWRKGYKTLREWYRVLAPGGRVYIATPNLRWIMQSYLDNGKVWAADLMSMHPEEQLHLEIDGSHIHTLWANFKIFSSGGVGDNHYACYDAFLLGLLLKKAGFTDIKVLEDDAALVMEGYKR